MNQTLMNKSNNSISHNMKEENIKIMSIQNIKQTLAATYMVQIKNYFGDEKKALKFLSSVVSSIERTPELQECTPESLFNSFMIMAQLEFMPSAVSGEAYVLPYNDRKSGNKIAQFQLGYQGIVTLLYKAGAKSVVSEIVRSNDKFSIINGSILHEIDPFKTREERGKQMGAYAIIITQTGGKVEKFMRMDEIMAHGKRFSKSFGSTYSPWNSENDPEGWMPRKTVLKQAAKLAPKNETLNIAIAEDNKDSNIDERINLAKIESEAMKMKALTVPKNTIKKQKDETIAKESKTTKEVETPSESLPEVEYGE